MGFLKEMWLGWGVEEGLLLFFGRLPQGFRMWARTMGLSKGRAVPRCRRVSLTTGQYVWHQMSIE